MEPIRETQINMRTKIIFITGATSGFGEAMAKLFAKEGARLILCGRRAERLKKLKKELEAKQPSPRPSPKGRGGIYTIALDVRDRGAVFAAVKNLPKEFAAIDVLVNNAGLALGLNRADQTELSDWEQMVDTNIKGVMYCTRAVLPGMVKRGRGHIVNIGSVAGTYPYAGGQVYGATKAFVKQFSLNLRCDLLGTPVRVTNIEPGMAETEFSKVRFHGDASKAKAVYKGTQALSAEDVAEAVRWAISQPPHVNVNRIELMPTMQALAGYAIHRE